MHEPDAQRRGRVEALPGDEVAARSALADLAEHVRGDHGGSDPELHLGEPERGPLVCDRDVGDGDEACAAPQRVAVDDRGHRRRARVDRVEHPPQRVRVGDVLVVREVD